MVDNLGYTERGQVLNCSSFEVARRVSQALEADKLIVYHGEQIAKLNLPAWIGLSDDNSYIWSQGESFESGRFTFSALPCPNHHRFLEGGQENPEFLLLSELTDL